MELTGASKPQPAAAPGVAAQIVDRIRAGDPSAEEELVRRFSRGLSIILRRAAADATLAEDLHQETFRVALAKIRAGEVRDPSRLAGFLASLARNLAIEHFRRRPPGGASLDADAVAHPASARAGPLDLLLKGEQAELARRVLADLPSERDRQVLFRFYVAEDDKRDICADLGLTSLQFNRVLFRARQRYRELYEKAVDRERPRTR
jgi:RNA polymerase sigma-70 factor (ECF subfamily)